MQGDRKGAVQLLDRNPDHPAALYMAARLRIEGKFEAEQAIIQLDHYLGLDPATLQLPPAAAWWRKGMAYELLGEMPKARASYEKSLALDPNFEQARSSLAKLDPAKG
jgi:tetratricopeptide (TPR) repeat protein